MPPAKKMPAKKSDTLPGGYKVGEKVFFTGTSQTFPSGDKVVHGQRGEVTKEPYIDSDGDQVVEVKFPGNKNTNICRLTEVRRLHAASPFPPRPPPTPPHLPAHAPPPLHRPGAPTPRGKRRRAPRGRTPRAGAVVAACVARDEGGGRRRRAGAEPHLCTAVTWGAH